MKRGLPQFPGVVAPHRASGVRPCVYCLFAVIPTGVSLMLAGVWYVCNMAIECNNCGNIFLPESSRWLCPCCGLKDSCCDGEPCQVKDS